MSMTEIMGAAMLAMPFVGLFMLVVRMEGIAFAVSIYISVFALLAWLYVGAALLKGVL